MAISKAYQINGVVDTSKTVLENLEILTSSCNTFFTFDVHTGKWSVIINQIGTSTKSFNDSNIIGSILLSSTGITDYYNQVQIDFPHKDLLDQTDTIIETIPTANWLPNEQSKILKLAFDTVNDPVQAQLLGAVQLKQSRVDKIIKFNTDYTSLGLQAGDLIDVTNSLYGFTNKIFRIININEADENDGSLTISITALEYNSAVYDTTTLTRQIRTPKNGIVQKAANEEIKKDSISLGGVALAVGSLAALGAIEKLLAGSIEAGGIFDTIFNLFKTKTGVDLASIFSSGSNVIKSTLIAKDEGTILTSSTKSINFVGEGVTATTSGDDVTVTINAGGTTGETGNGNAITKPADTTSTSTGGEVCPISFVKPGSYYVPPVIIPKPWKDSCTIGKHWTVIPKVINNTVNAVVDLQLFKVIQYGSGPYYARFTLCKPATIFNPDYNPTIFPKVGNYYWIEGLESSAGEEYVKCSACIPNESVTVEYEYNPGIIKIPSIVDDTRPSFAILRGTNGSTTTSTTESTYYNNGYGTILKDFTLSNPSDLNYTGTYSLEMSCTIGYINLSLPEGIPDQNISGKRLLQYSSVITPKKPLKVTSTGDKINSIIGNGTWWYVKEPDEEDHGSFQIPPPNQSVDIIYKITYNGDTKLFTDTMTYVPYDQFNKDAN
jgi:hypothetical protein